MRHTLTRLSLLSCLSLSLLPGTTSAQTPAAPAHHGPHGFQNTEPFVLPSATDLMRWTWQRLTQAGPDHDPTAVPWQLLGTLPRQAPADQLLATWLGHATVLVQSGGWAVLTDPIFSERASPLSWIGPRRLTPAPLSSDWRELPDIDVVVLSHNHYDHLDLPTLRRLHARSSGRLTVIAPLGHRALLQKAGLTQIIELDWWESTTLTAADRPPLVVTLTPARHWSLRRFVPSDRYQALWGGAVIATGKHRVYFAGDTGDMPAFQEIGDRLGPFDLALLPIGAYEPRAYLKAQHTNPEEALRAHQQVRARESIGIHWGTFVLSSEALQQPPLDLATAKARTGLSGLNVWPIGETRVISAAPSAP